MRTASSTAKPSRRETPMIAPSGIRFCWAMRWRCMQTRPIPRAPHAKSWRALASKIRCSARGYRGHPLSAADVIRNDKIAVTRSGGERPFATYKSRYGLARTRLMGLVRNMAFYGFAAIAHNIQKGAKFLLLYGLLEAEQMG